MVNRPNSGTTVNFCCLSIVLYTMYVGLELFRIVHCSTYLHTVSHIAPVSSSVNNATSTHRRTFGARARVGMCRQCARPRAPNVRHSDRVRATMRLLSVFPFRIKGRSCLNTSDPTTHSESLSRLVSEQSEQFSCSEVTS
jgi:hypothetical protein